MNILLTNDDGYQSKALQQLCRELSALSGVNVYVVAPMQNKSCTSHCMIVNAEIEFKQLEEYPGATKAFYCDAMPANCTIFGLSQLGVTIDLVISGPNYGPNYGQDALYSGTVGAAEEAVCNGVRAIALSRDGFGEEGSVDACINYVVDNLDLLYKYNVPETYLNINAPIGEVKGVVVVEQCSSTLIFKQEHVYNKDRTTYQLVGDNTFVVDDKSNDINMCSKGYITITPMKINSTDYQAIALLEQLLLG